ncbi:MAG TPA: 3-oxoacyl-[acyl-carrier-protein] synthase III C-terminal domain-containing protein [Prolixibacteraceae bacterium]|nr:3-oxoacyl-[acyl-carrier-protein] synthase III C-terminal domain-containing protein [Prolixibacteraceae bacterium]
MSSAEINPRLSGSNAVKPSVPVGIVAIGMYVPPKIVGNSEFVNVHLSPQEAAFFGTDPHFDDNKRRVAENETAMEMAVKAARKALDDYHIDPKTIDLVLFTSSCKDLARLEPPMANYVQSEIGAENANSFNIDCGFNGWLPSVITGASYIASGFYKKVLVVTGETIVESMDCSTSEALFMGDGAGAVVLQQVDEGDGLLSFHLMSKECVSAAGVRVSGGFPNYSNKEWDIRPYLYVAPGSFERDIPALEVYIPFSVKESLQILSKSPDEVDCYVFGQQFYALNVIWANKVGVDYTKVHDTIWDYSCMKCASIPVSLADAVAKGKIKKGDLVAFGDQGANWSISSAIFRWCI